VYVGPLTPQDVPQLLEDVRAGRPVLPEKQLARRLVADPRANSREFPLHPAEHTARAGAVTPAHDPRRAGVGPSMDEDRPGPTAAIEPETELEEGSS